MLGDCWPVSCYGRFAVTSKAVVVAKRRTRFFVPVPKRCLGAKIRSPIKFLELRVLSESVVAFCLGRSEICELEKCGGVGSRIQDWVGVRVYRGTR